MVIPILRQNDVNFGMKFWSTIKVDERTYFIPVLQKIAILYGAMSAHAEHNGLYK